MFIAMVWSDTGLVQPGVAQKSKEDKDEENGQEKKFVAGHSKVWRRSGRVVQGGPLQGDSSGSQCSSMKASISSEISPL